MNFLRRRAMPGLLALVCILASVIVSVPLPGNAGRTYAAAGPDLIVQAITWTPQNPALGDRVRFSITVANQGDDTAGNSRLLFSIDGHTIDSAILSPIAAGDMLTYIFSWNAAAGSHVVNVIADSDEMVTESDENNNEKSYAFSVLAPDLIISSITWSPEKPSLGDNIVFTITTQNIGDKAANTHWVEFFIDGASRGQREGQPVNSGASYTRTYTWVAQPGQHILRATADVLGQSPESNETNNDLTVVYCTTPPDLTIASIKFLPVNRTESGNVTMYTTVKNQGEGDSSGAWVNYYVDGTQQSHLYVKPLAAGANTTMAYNWQPGPDERVFSAVVDEQNAIFESDESNNSRSLTIPGIGLPELSIKDLTWTPKIPLVNSRITFNVAVKNSGTRTAPSSLVAIYLTGAIRLTRMTGPIAPGATVTVNIDWLADTQEKNIRAVADDENAVAESDETNNESYYTITPQQPVATADLTVESITCNPSSPASGETAVIKAVIQNQGTGPAPASNAVCYVDNEVAGVAYFNSIPAKGSLETTIKWKAVPGAHQVRIIVDMNDEVLETNEANNEASTIIFTSDPDLAIESIEWFPVNPVVGQDVQFTITVKNQGTRQSGQCFVTYYIDGTKRGEHYIDPIDPGASLTRNFTWNMQSPTVMLRAAIDEAGAVLESNKNNNDKSVYIPAPDLTINSVTSSDDYPVADTLISFTADIFNAGRSEAGVTHTTAYIDGNSLADVETTALKPGDSAQSVFYWTAVPGKHTLRIVADAGNAITESNENNNTNEVIIFVPLPSKNNIEPAVTPADTGNTTVAATENTTAKDVPLTEKDLIKTIKNTSANETKTDISGNISAKPKPAAGGIKDVLMNKWLLIGVAAAGVSAIGVLMVLRKRSAGGGKEKTPKAPKQPKVPKPPKAAKPAKAPKPDTTKDKPKPVAKPPAKPVMTTGTGKSPDTLSGKPPVIVPPPPKPSGTPVLGAPIIKPAPPAGIVPPSNPNLGQTLIKQTQTPPPGTPPVQPL